MANITPDKQAVLDKALASPEDANSKIIIAKARERGWLQAETPQQQPQGISKTESALRGASQGATFGFSDELSPLAQKTIGLANYAIGKGRQKLGLGGAEQVAGAERTLETPMSQMVAEERQSNKEAQKANPWSYGGGQLVGGTVATLPALVSGAGAGGLAAAVKARPIAVGTATGVLQGLGEGEGLYDRAIKAGVGGAVGAGTGLLFSSPQKLKSVADNYAQKALGFIKSTIKKAGGEPKTRAAARDLLDRGVIKGGLGTIANNVKRLKDEAGAFIGQTLDDLDKAGVKALNANEMVSKILESTPNPKLKLTLGQMLEDPMFADLQKPVEQLVASVQHNLGDASTFQAAQRLKMMLGERGWRLGRELPGNELYQDAYRAVSQSIDDAIANAAPKIGDKNLAKKFLDMKKAYQSVKTAELGIEEAIQQATGNRKLGLTDLIFISNQMAAGNPAGAIAGLFGKKLMESKGMQSFMANALNKLGFAAPFTSRIAIPAATGGTQAMSTGLAGLIDKGNQ